MILKKCGDFKKTILKKCFLHLYKMKKYIKIFIATIIVIHFLLLHYFGISTFITTLLFYYLIYILFKFLIGFLKDETLKKILLVNTGILLFLLIALEILFINKLAFIKNYMENKNGVYFSEYMRTPQLELINFLLNRDIKTGWETGFNPNTLRVLKSDEYNYNYTTNAIGLRGRIPSAKKDTDEFRILVLGDSYIEGFGTSDDSTFTVLLSTKLNKVNKKVTVINAGICGSNPIYEINLYFKKLKKFHPDLIILETNLTDIYDVNYASHNNKMPFSEHFFAISHIYRMFDIFMFKNNIISENSSAKMVKKRELIIHQIIQKIQQFNFTLSLNKQRLMILYLPWQNELENKKANQNLTTNSLSDSLNKSGLNVLNLQKEYKKHIPINQLTKYYWENEGHHTPLGYNLMAEIVSKKIISENYITVP